MVLDPADPTIVTSLTVFVEGDDNPVQTFNEVHQPDNIESTVNGILLTEDPGSASSSLLALRFPTPPRRDYGMFRSRAHPGCGEG